MPGRSKQGTLGLESRKHSGTTPGLILTARNGQGEQKPRWCQKRKERQDWVHSNIQTRARASRNFWSIESPALSFILLDSHRYKHLSHFILSTWSTVTCSKWTNLPGPNSYLERTETTRSGGENKSSTMTRWGGRHASWINWIDSSPALKGVDVEKG